MSTHPPRKNRRTSGRPADAAPQPVTERELDELQDLLDRVPAPFEPLDVSMLDGFLCGLLVQPRPLPASRWMAHVTDVDGRCLPPAFDASRLHALVLRRHAELGRAIAHRQWFDPWVFELADEAVEARDAGLSDLESDPDDDFVTPPGVDAVYPWVAGFAAALELFPELVRADAPGSTEALALLYRHLSPDDLEDADALLAEIESLEPPAGLAEAVEELVRATLLLADVGQSLAASMRPRPARGPETRRR